MRERKEKIYMELPRLREIEQELSLLGVTAAKMVLKRAIDAEEAVAQLQQEQKLAASGDLLHALEKTDPLRLYLQEIENTAVLDFHCYQGNHDDYSTNQVQP